MSPRRARLPAASNAAPAGRRWLLFVHQLPSQPSNLRVSTWRRLQQLGAVPVKQAIYALPDTPDTREDFEWLKTEVASAGGDAIVFAASHVDRWSDDELVEEFRRARQASYDRLAEDAEHVLQRAGRARTRAMRAPAYGRLTDIFRERLLAIERVDFFGSAGRDRVLAALRALDERTAPPIGSSQRDVVSAALATHQGRLWVTRPRPGVDRMSSAWLIRRFIDSRARFAFAPDREAVPEDGVAFDMFGVAFSHQDGGCTFETLCAVFGLDRPALGRIAAIVHDLDLKDDRFRAPECGTVGAMIEGLQIAFQDDHALLAQGMTLFDSLHRSFERAARTSGPRPVARTKPRAAGQRRKTR